MDGITRRIVVLGKTGGGKSSLANTIFGETLFDVNSSPTSGTSKCQAETRSVRGKRITWIDTPGIFDTRKSEEDMKVEIVRCITECAPGPHVFLIVLKVERYTEQEEAVIEEIVRYFSEEAYKYAVVLFTHGDQLDEDTQVEDFIKESKSLSRLVSRCGGRCHVIDNRYWKKSQDDEYRSNELQVSKLFETIDNMIEENDGKCYTNETLQAWEKEIQQEKEKIEKASADLSPEEITRKAKDNVFLKQLLKYAASTAVVVLGVLLGAAFTVVGR